MTRQFARGGKLYIRTISTHAVRFQASPASRTTLTDPAGTLDAVTATAKLREPSLTCRERLAIRAACVDALEDRLEALHCDAAG